MTKKKERTPEEKEASMKVRRAYDYFMLDNREKMFNIMEEYLKNNSFEGWTSGDDTPISPESAKDYFFYEFDAALWYYDRFKPSVRGYKIKPLPECHKAVADFLESGNDDAKKLYHLLEDAGFAYNREINKK